MGETPKAPRPGVYQHYQGAFYQVFGVAEDPETAGKWVVYRSLGMTEDWLPKDDAAPGDTPPGPRVVKNPSGGALAVCTVERFTQEVAGGDYWPGRRVPRFRLISPSAGDAI